MKTKSLKLSSFLLFIVGQSLYAQQTMKSYYDYKKTKIHEECLTNAAGAKSGQYKEYSEAGVVITTGTYKDNTKIGLWQYKTVAGTMDIETYDVNGDRNGKWLKYCPSYPKFKMMEGNYKNNQKDGLWIEYFCESQPASKVVQIEKQETYVLGKVSGKCSYFKKSGEKEEGLIENNIKLGEWKVFGEDGKLFKTRTYGKKFDAYNQIDESIFFTNGQKQKRQILENYSGDIVGYIGEELYYDSLGVLTTKNLWHKDSIASAYYGYIVSYQGTHTEYFSNGKVSVTTDIRFDKGNTYYIGHNIFYYQNGNKKTEYDCDNYGEVINGTTYKYLENGEPDEATKALINSKKGK